MAEEKNVTSSVLAYSLLLSILWWVLAGQFSLLRSILVASISLAALATGCITGFVFTSYGEETGTIGKIRDALVGGATALTIAKASAIKNLVLTFAFGPGPREFAVVAGSAVVFSVFGFLSMFLLRELVWNVLLAKKRAERDQIEGTKSAGLITQQLTTALPVSILSGIEDIDDLVESRKDDAERFRQQLDSDDVKKFLDDAEEATRNGTPIDWDVVSKVANLHYYKTYFEKDGEKEAQEELAYQWIRRALLMNPFHVDFIVKCADVLGMMNRYLEAVKMLEDLDRTNEAPAYLKQWLGYFLLFVPNREDDAIRYSREYHRKFPDDGDPLFNIACGYAQKYCTLKEQLKRSGVEASADLKELRDEAVNYMRQALALEPDYADTVLAKWFAKGESFECLSDDKELLSLLGKS